MTEEVREALDGFFFKHKLPFGSNGRGVVPPGFPGTIEELLQLP
jgi:hypothetical protein